ncbi:MAG: hypothetical protein GXX85_03755 [Ignavibacteria bacterium]|nr:hypothetical protein [Ignavibacteria bacterium]
MNLINKYLIQSISTAAENLRLNTEKIEIVSLLKSHLEECNNLSGEINRLKRRTEFSKLAIKLDQILQFIQQGNFDYLTISDKFKEHSASIIMDLSNTLDVCTPKKVIEIFNELKKQDTEVEFKIDEEIKENIDNNNQSECIEKTKNSELKLAEYESIILEAVKEIDPLLKRLNTNEYSDEELEYFEDVFLKNADLSRQSGFSLIADMHTITSKAISQLREKNILALAPVIEGIRACLIVIVAVVRGKEVDITGYLNKAEIFGERINALKEETK